MAPAFMDSHTHLDFLTWDNLMSMSTAGIREIVSPCFLAGTRAFSNDVIWEMWDHLIDIEIPRGEQNLIKTYGMIGISMVSTPKDDPSELYSLIPRYLQNPKIIAIGEIGIEPASQTCTDLKKQEEYVQKQIEIAKQTGVVVNFHVPNPADQKKKFTERLLSICKEIGMMMSKVTIDHSNEVNIKTALDAGAYSAITVQSWRNMTPQIAAKLVKEHGSERIMIDSDCGGGPSDPLAVAKTAMELRRIGVGEKDIDKVCYFNGRQFYGLTD